MPHSLKGRKYILTRVHHTRGQVDVFERVLEFGEPCLAILQQVAAVRGAPNGLMGKVVGIYLKGGLVSEETTPGQRAVHTAEIGYLLRAHLK